MQNGEISENYAIHNGRPGLVTCVNTFKFFVLIVLAVSCSTELETENANALGYGKEQSQFVLDKETFAAILEVNSDMFIEYLDSLQLSPGIRNEIWSWLDEDHGAVLGRVEELNEEIIQSQGGYINTSPKLVEERKGLKVELDDIEKKMKLLEENNNFLDGVYSTTSE